MPWYRYGFNIATVKHCACLLVRTFIHEYAVHRWWFSHYNLQFSRVSRNWLQPRLLVDRDINDITIIFTYWSQNNRGADTNQHNDPNGILFIVWLFFSKMTALWKFATTECCHVCQYCCTILKSFEWITPAPSENESSSLPARHSRYHHCKSY